MVVQIVQEILVSALCWVHLFPCQHSPGVHLGKGHLDLEAIFNRFDLSTKEELAHQRHVKLQGRQRRFLAAKRGD